MKNIIKKALLTLAAVTLIGTIAAPKNVIAMPKSGDPVCNFCGATKSCLCSVLESQYHCGSTKYEHGVIYTLGCRNDNGTCRPEWMKVATPASVAGGKTDAHNAEEKKQLEVYSAQIEAHLNAYADQLSLYEAIRNDAYAKQYALYEEMMSNASSLNTTSLDAYTEQIALYEAIINDANAKITAYLNAYAELHALYNAAVNANAQ